MLYQSLDFDRYCLPNLTQAVLIFQSNATDKVAQYLFDLYTAWQVLAISVGVAVILTLIFMLILRCCAKLLIWLSMLAFIAILGIIGWFFWDKYQNTTDPGDQMNYKILAIIFWVGDGVFVLVLIAMYDDIQLALSIIEAAATFIFQACTVIFVPFYAIVWAVGFLIYWIGTVIFLYSVGTFSQYGITPLPSVQWDETTKNLWYYHLFALFWIMAFILAWVQFVVAATAVQWYFSSSSDTAGSGSVCKSTYWSFRFHVGSLAFGSLILAIVMFIRFIFEYMKVYYYFLLKLYSLN